MIGEKKHRQEIKNRNRELDRVGKKVSKSNRIQEPYQELKNRYTELHRGRCRKEI